MHDDEFREEQKVEITKLTCCLVAIVLVIGLMIKGFVCLVWH